ncbi:hypothetical protein ES703_10839 [subsurface metagenome]
MAPPIAASRQPSPSFILRYITSVTTMLLSIRRPTAIAIALRVRRLIVMPEKCMTRKPINTLNGIDIAVTSEARKAHKKRKTMNIAKMPPIIAISNNWLMLFSMNSDWSKSGTSLKSPSRFASISCAFSITAFATSTVFASPSFITKIATLASPSVRVITVFGAGPSDTLAISPSTTLSTPMGAFSIASRES